MLQFSYGFSYFQNIFNQFYHILALCFFRKTFENFIFNVVYFSLVWVILKLNITFDYTVFGLFWPSFLLCHYLFKVDTFRTDSKKIRYTYTTQFIFHHDKKKFFFQIGKFCRVHNFNCQKLFYIFTNDLTKPFRLWDVWWNCQYGCNIILWYNLTKKQTLPQLAHNIHRIFAECSLSVAILGTSTEHLRNIFFKKIL